MNFSKLFLLMALGVSLNNVACGMKQNDDDKKYKQEDEHSDEQQKKVNQDENRIFIDLTNNDKENEKLIEILNSLNPWDSIDYKKNLIRNLLEDNANPNIQNTQKLTLLHFAVLQRQEQNDWYPSKNKGRLKIAKLLIEHNANPNIKRSNGDTPLHLAVLFNTDEKCVELLLKHGANPNIQNTDSKTPLHLARKKECVELLLKHNASPSIKDDDGNTLLHIVTKNGRKDCVESIINYVKSLVPVKSLQGFEHLCLIDKNFKEQVKMFLLINNRKKKSWTKNPKISMFRNYRNYRNIF